MSWAVHWNGQELQFHTLHEIAKVNKVKNSLGASERTDCLSIGLHSSSERRRACSLQYPFIPVAEDLGCLDAPTPFQPWCYMSV